MNSKKRALKESILDTATFVIAALCVGGALLLAFTDRVVRFGFRLRMTTQLLNLDVVGAEGELWADGL
jgi:hypothetical protein